MARLIPSFLDDRTPPGERDVFNMLAAAKRKRRVYVSLDQWRELTTEERKHPEIEWVIDFTRDDIQRDYDLAGGTTYRNYEYGE